MFLDIANSFGLLFSIQNFLSMFLGVSLGVVLGAIPGLTGIMAIALIIPVTYYLSPVSALLLLLAVSKGATYGGSIPAILINAPGTPAAAATAIDGYTLALQGKSTKALKMALYASIIADTFSDVMLLLVAGFLAQLAIKFGPSEYSMLILFSLTMVVVVSGKSLLKGLIAASFGLLLGTIGVDPVAGIPRFDLGFVELYEGLPLIPMVIGIFALAEVFSQFEGDFKKKYNKFLPLSKVPEDNKVTKEEFRICSKHILRASILGTFIGAIPGVGPTVSSFINYSEAKRTSHKPELFGKGSIEGIAAAEAGNNAVCGANLIPLLSLGVPGDATAAVLLGAFMLQGLTPGPLLFEKHAPIMYAFFIGLILCNLVNFFIGNIAIMISRKICDIRKEYILSAIILFCCIGSYSFNNSMFDVKIMFLFGVIGYLMNKFKFPVASLIIAFILQPIAELSIRQSLIISDGSVLPFFTRPISLFFILLTVLSLIFDMKRRKKIKCKSINKLIK